MDEIHICTPQKAYGQIDSKLVMLTEQIAKIDPDKVAHGFLGGEFGYGAHWNNDVFMMHPYCWCDQPECPWCSGADPNFHHKPSGFRATWYKYIGRSMEVENVPADLAALNAIFAECIASLKEKRDGRE